ncbi:MAG: Excinuclease ABCsubunit C domain-containing protein [Candidatus Gottesmanbacteria bacterium GW2011_GWB1_49_7]|uniref:Excinuclease ABCsubunit C domain-containing protein n=1 Tax=Candidatus Gottesmanbacteria bacterium GW2011_GWB1_49_7 TaxID=1618448 RepID=A0A0G1VUN7_9BACT|nr:MAG: Excinuclease ABCsubunit C domain-containing protein [Candidatus Gottesmanbacteria bacterium GW2011_GWB1_49_7]
MFWVYVLYSLKDRRLYVGQTVNLEKRLALHNRGMVAATKFRRPLKLVHSETYPTRREAMERESFLKSLWASRFKKFLLAKLQKCGTM